MKKHSADKVEELKSMLKGHKDSAPHAHVKKHAEHGDATDKKKTEDLSAKLALAEETSKKNYDTLLRTVAEFENYKKRMDREMQGFAKYVHEPLIGDLVNVIDDLERVESHIPEHASKESKAIGEGVKIVHKSLQKVFDKYGLKTVEAKKGMQFNPSFTKLWRMFLIRNINPAKY